MKKNKVNELILMADGEGGAEVYSIATKADQSRIIFSEAVHMVKQSPALSKFIHKRKTDMYMPITFSTMAPLASESKSLDGLNSHCVIIDELHAIRDRNLYDEKGELYLAEKEDGTVALRGRKKLSAKVQEEAEKMDKEEE